MVVLLIGLQVVYGAGALSHLTTLPVSPLSDNNPLLKPEQMAVPPLTEPFTVTGDTSILTGVKVPDGHVPL